MAPPRTRLLGRCCRPYSYAEMIGRPRPAVNPQLCRRRLGGRCPNRVYALGESRRGLASKTACLRNGARVLLATAPGTKPSGARIFTNEYQDWARRSVGPASAAPPPPTALRVAPENSPPSASRSARKIKSSSTASVSLGQILAVPNFVSGSGEHAGCYDELS